MSLSDRIEQARRDFEAMGHSARDMRRTLAEIQDALDHWRHFVRWGPLLLAFLLGVLLTLVLGRLLGG